MAKLFLVSCARTTLDGAGVFQSASDHRLSPQGIEHASLLTTHLQDERIDSFYSSPLEGAFHTASILGARHRRGIIRLDDLQEMDWGGWSGKTVEELREFDAEAVVTWQFEPHKHRMPSGETVAEVQERIVQALDEILSVEKGKGVCVVTHAIPVKAAMCHFMNDDLSLIWLTPRQRSTALNTVDFENDERRVTEVGSVKHLGEEIAAPSA